MTASSRQESDSDHWTLEGPGGRSNIHVASGLVIGEDERGNFEIAPADEQAALVRFQVEGRAVHIHLVSRDWTLASRDRIVGDSFRSERTVELHLPNNVFRVVGGEDPAAEPEHLELTRRPSVNWLRPGPLRTDVRRAAEGVKIRALTPRRSLPDELPIVVGPTDRHTQPTGAHRQRVVKPGTATLNGVQRLPNAWLAALAGRERLRNPWMTALIGFAGGIAISLLLLYPALRGDRVPESPAMADAGPVSETSPAQETALAQELSAAANREPAAAATSLPSEPLPMSAEGAPSTTGPEGGEAVADRTVERSPEIPSVAALTIEPVEVPPVERRSIPRASDSFAAVEAVAVAETIDSEPDPALVAELEEIGATAETLATELALRRDLLAADLALAQGRLTNPPETSAYMLYSRVLAMDPASPKAMNGLQSIRQQLINRALAQLAGGSLEDARSTLDAAADAGVDPMLVADLRGEVDHRQQRIDAQGGSSR